MEDEFTDNFYITIISNDKSVKNNKASNFTTRLYKNIELAPLATSGGWEVALVEYQYAGSAGKKRQKAAPPADAASKKKLAKVADKTSI